MAMLIELWWVGRREKREQGRFSNHGQMTLWKDSERKGVWGQHIIIAVTEIPKHWFNSKWVLLVLQGLFRNRKLKLLKFAARCLLFSCLCSKRRKNCVRARAILSHLRFWKGICKTASWIGLEILIPKHPWKSKIGLLQPILAAKRYVSFFLGHPVQTLRFCCEQYNWWR